jgi:hypothetical protein
VTPRPDTQAEIADEIVGNEKMLGADDEDHRTAESAAAGGR